MFGIYMKRYYLLYGLCFSASKENPIKPNHVEVEKQEKKGETDDDNALYQFKTQEKD